MTQAPAGWYPDPAGLERERFWDGDAWDHERDQDPSGWAPPDPDAPGSSRSDRIATALVPEATTPDGRALASWLERLAALILDVIVLYLLGLLLSVVWGRDVLGNLAKLAEGDAVPALPTSLFVARLLLPVVYFGGFLLWRQATPGKLLVGLRVQGVGAAGVGPRAATLRWLVLAGPSYVLLAFPPGLSIIGTLWILLDCLLPLWDRNNQALHDKAAGTYVVRR